MTQPHTLSEEEVQGIQPLDQFAEMSPERKASHDAKHLAGVKLANLVKAHRLYRGYYFHHVEAGGLYCIICPSIDEETLEHLITYESIEYRLPTTRKLQVFLKRFIPYQGAYPPCPTQPNKALDDIAPNLTSGGTS